MAAISAAMVKELREKTDAPMMECKKALTEAEGDMARAEEILRVKLGNKATKAASRVTADGKIGENISIRRFQVLTAKGKLHNYIHGGAKIGAIVDIVGGDDEVAHDVAMHIAASKPKALNAEGVDPELIEKERRVASEKARENGKPEEMIARIAEGSVNKFLKEVTLMSQPFVKDDKKTVSQLLKEHKAEVSAFALFVVGEGMEKRSNDFAAEVAAQAAAARA